MAGPQWLIEFVCLAHIAFVVELMKLRPWVKTEILLQFAAVVL